MMIGEKITFPTEGMTHGVKQIDVVKFGDVVEGEVVEGM